MIAALLFAFLAPSGADVRYVDASLDLDVDLLDHRFVDTNVDGRLELWMAVRRADGARELRRHEVEDERISAGPSYSLSVMEDVLAYGFADVRAEPGLEVVFLTKTGAWSCSPTKEGLRDNVRRLVQAELIYDVPDRDALAGWEYFVEGDPRDEVLLPGRDGFAVYGLAPEASDEDPRTATYRSRGEFGSSFRKERDQVGGEQADGEVGFGNDGFTVREPRDLDIAFLLGDEASRTSGLASDRLSYRAPALADLDGDGDRDLVQWAKDGLHVHLNGSDGLSGSPTRIEHLPEYLREHADELTLTLVDLDGDGRTDLLAQIQAEADGFENSDITLLVLPNDGRRLLPTAPRQVLRFAAAFVRPGFVDVNDDGRPDLVLREFELPSLVETVTGLEFRLTHLVFLAAARGERMYERKPALRQTQVFDEETVGAAIANRDLVLDCDGDGVPDLVEVDLSGRIAIRRLVHESGFFGGERWELETTPWKRFDTRGSIESLSVRDLNGDGLGDVVSRGREALTVLLSARGKGGRR